MAYYLRSDGKGYMVKVKGVRKTVKTEAQAKALDEAMLMQAKLGTLTVNKVEKAKPDASTITVKEGFWKAWETLYAHKADPQAEIRTNLWIEYLGPKTLISSITGEMISDGILHFRKKGNGGSTLNKKRAIIKVLMRYCFENHWTKLDFKLRWDKVVKSGHRRRITDAEEQAMYYWTGEYKHPKESVPRNPRFRWIIQLLLWTGMRPEEALSLPFTDVDWQKGQINLWAARTKTSTDRFIPLTPQAAEAMKMLFELRGNHGVVYPNGYRNFLKNWNVMKARMELAHDTKFVPYAMRHTCAKRLVAMNVHPERIREWLGHDDLDTTMIYMADDSVGLQDAAKALSQACAQTVCPPTSVVPFKTEGVPKVYRAKKRA